MQLYFAGSEQSSHRKLLAAEGVTHVALSYMGLRRKITFSRPWTVTENFSGQKIFLDSGAYTINNAPVPPHPEELLALAHHYTNFVEDNIEGVEFVSELDALVLGHEWIRAQREGFYDALGEKFMPIWHPETGTAELDRLCATYARVGITQEALESQGIIPTLNSMINRHGIKLHGIGITQPELMAKLRFDSVSSTSWVSPAQFGDTIIWSAGKLHRYPKKMKDRARLRHRVDITNAGFDAALVEADDPTEILRLSIWSWRQLIDHLNETRFTTRLVTQEGYIPPGENADQDSVDVAHPEGEMGNEIAIHTPRTVLPGIRTETIEQPYTDPADGTLKRRMLPVIRLDDDALLQCDNCHVATTCRAHKAGASCAFLIPVSLRTPEQRDDFDETVLEIQAQRVLQGRRNEQLGGGYLDANLSVEIDRYAKLSKQVHERDQEGFSLTIQARQSGRAEMGVISRLFGRDPADGARVLPPPPPAGDVLDADVIDGE